jgi:peptide/nickel transport system substrate-binding protein
MSDRIGQQFGNYRLVALLGQGGFAEVYLGQHVRLNLQAAIKVLHTHLTEQEVAHFQQEAETIAKLMHPSIVRILDYDVQDGVPFLVMDYAPNGSLRRRYPRGSVAPLPQIVSSVKQVADALQYAHDQKFIHRDVKPENMLLGRWEEVLLSDFGLAALAHSSASLSTQEAIGTLPYMAPEQIEGHPRAASDQYALGVVVYEWLCGSRPFEGSATEVMVQHLTMPPPLLHEQVATIPLGIEQVVLRALAKDPKERFASVHDFATALEQAEQRAFSPTAQLASEQPPLSLAAATSYDTVAVVPNQPVLPTEATPSADVPVGALEPTVYPGSSAPDGLDTPQGGAAGETPQQGQVVAPMAAVVPAPLEPTMPVQPKARRLPRISAALLIGLVVLVIAGGVLGSLSLLAHFGVLSTHSGATTPAVVRGGTWTDDFAQNPNSFIPNWAFNGAAKRADQALYLPLFYGDSQGVVHAGAATEIPNVQNGGISADAKTWTFHLRTHLVWSDGQPYDARDVDYTWKLWSNPKFGASSPLDPTLISRADVSADHLTITFHLTRAYAPFRSLWVDGVFAPLPAHHFNRMPPGAIPKSPDNLNPQVVSGPFMLAESKPGDHYTLVRNPRYYRASEGLPYLDKVVFRVVSQNSVLKDLQAGAIDSSMDLLLGPKFQEYRRLTNYTLVTSPTTANFEALYFNFHNQVLATHPEVRAAIAKAIDHQALIATVPQGIASLLCTDHGSAYYPGYDPSDYCPVFDPATANKLLEDSGWVKGSDGVRTRDGQRLEFEYSTLVSYPPPGRLDGQAIVQRNLQAIGIKLDIENYDNINFVPLVPEAKASPPTGAVAGRYDIAEWSNYLNYDPDDSSLLSCDQFPPKGGNFDYYCNHALDALYQQEQATVDSGVRQLIFSQIHQIYLADFPFIVLYGTSNFGLARKGTHNYSPGPFLAEGETINIWEWWCDNGKC